MAITHILSATTPDDPAYEIRPSHWNSAHAQLLTISGNTAGQSTFSGTNLVFSGGPNATLSLNGNTLVFSGGAGAAGNTGYISGGTTNASLGTVSFANGNGVSFGVDGQTLTASIASSLTNIRVSAGTTSNLLSALTFADGNGLSFGINASTITASHNGLTSQSNQNVTAGNGGFAFQTLSFSNANGMSFGTSAGSAITGSYTVPTVPAQISVGNSNLGNTAGDTGVFTGRVVFVGSDNITLSGSSNAGSATVSIIGAAGGGGLTNIRVSAGTTSNLLSALTFADSNGLAFGINASTITGSYTRPVVSNAIQSVGSATGSGTNTSRFAADDHVHAGVFSVGVSNVGNTAGDTRVDVGRFVLAGGANITLSQATAANALNTISIVGGAGAGGAAISAAGNSVSNGTVVFSNSNNVSFGMAGSTVTATITVPAQTNQTVGVYHVGNTTGQSSSSTADARTISIDGAGIVSAGWSAGSIRISATQSNQAVSNSAGSFTFQTLNFSNANNVTWGTSAGGIVTASVAAPGAAAENNWINLLGANTSGNTTASGSTIGLSGINATLSGTNGSVVNISVPATSSLVGTSGISISTNGSTISVRPVTGSGWEPYRGVEYVVGAQGQGTLAFNPVDLGGVVQFDRLVIPMLNTNSSNSSGSHTVSFWVGIYSRNASSLSLLQSTSSSTAVTHSGTAGSYSLYSGVRLFTIPLTSTLSAKEYWLGVVSRTTSGGANGSYSQLLATYPNTNFLGHFGSSHNTTYQMHLGRGVYTATTSGMPDSVGFSQIRGSDSLGLRAPMIYFQSGTA